MLDWPERAGAGLGGGEFFGSLIWGRRGVRQRITNYGLLLAIYCLWIMPTQTVGAIYYVAMPTQTVGAKKNIGDRSHNSLNEDAWITGFCAT